MKYMLANKRKEIIKKVWEIYKCEMSMEELAEVFKIPLSSFYRILKEVKLKAEIKSKTKSCQRENMTK